MHRAAALPRSSDMRSLFSPGDRFGAEIADTIVAVSQHADRLWQPVLAFERDPVGEERTRSGPCAASGQAVAAALG